MEFQEIISEFFNSPQMKQMIAGFIAYLTANLGTIILFGVKYAKAKGADIVYLPIYYQPASLILTQANKMGYKPTEG